jgi:hypothetical protein
LQRPAQCAGRFVSGAQSGKVGTGFPQDCATMTRLAGLETLRKFRHTARMRKAFVFAVLIALSSGLSACTKCESYRFWTGPKVCANP